jgi:hypothetical protein
VVQPLKRAQSPPFWVVPSFGGVRRGRGATAGVGVGGYCRRRAETGKQSSNKNPS